MLSIPVKATGAKRQIGSSQPEDPAVDPLYLFLCGLSWNKRSNASAGWELVRFLKSSGQTARIAAALLAQTKNIELPVQCLARATSGHGQCSHESDRAISDVSKVVAP